MRTQWRDLLLLAAVASSCRSFQVTTRSKESRTATTVAANDYKCNVTILLNSTTPPFFASVVVPTGTRCTEELQPPLQSKEGSTLSSRREWLQRTGTLLVAGSFVGGAAVVNHKLPPKLKKSIPKKLGPVNVTSFFQETSLNVTLTGPLTFVAVDPTTFRKTRSFRLPSWVPPAFVPPPLVIRDVTTSELATAAIIAGSITEMARTSLLYPLLTLKNRVQTDIRTRYSRSSKSRIRPLRRFKLTRLYAQRHFQEGRLYAGILPSLTIAVPATGLYYGVRDLVKRALSPLPVDGIYVALVAAFLADIASLMVKTPADTLSIRLQVATGRQSHSQHIDQATENPANSQDQEVVGQESREFTDSDDSSDEKSIAGNWFIESIERLPASILTDIPYLLSRVALNRILIQGGPVDLGRYEETVIATAVLCGFLTTPFDVARTRILLDSDDDPTNGIDGGSGEGLIRTFKTIYNEGDGGLANLFAGWLERTAYLAIGRAWLEPLQIVAYAAIRDAILLEWFD